MKFIDSNRQKQSTLLVFRLVFSLLALVGIYVSSLQIVFAGEHPKLVITADDIVEMRKAIVNESAFRNAFLAKKEFVDKQLAQPIVVPVPKDSGGGYTHEQHKKNYKLMYDAGVIFQLTQDKSYAQYVRDMLLEYAALYPSLPVHPKRRPNAKNPGKLFWQSLNEAVWLVYTIQAYDLIYDSLSQEEVQTIESGIIRPVASFLSFESPYTFNRVHNHGTWVTAGFGMAGYVLGESEWVEKALYDLDKSGKGGFLRQLSELFSPDGYYNEGPYYQRYALLPFVTFAKAIDNNEPSRKIFEYRDGVIPKAIDTTIQLSYNKLFFPINDAIKDKGIDTEELVIGVTIAYGLTGDRGLLDIAKQQNQILLTGDGMRVAQALEENQQQPYEFKSFAFGDGRDGSEGALVVFRNNNEKNEQALVFKPAAQGLGHGHFDKLTWLFYDGGEEIVSDYGAARFLNVEAKNGGRYLPENTSYAKQTIAHNTLVVDRRSHFDNDLKVANKNHPELVFFAADKHVRISSATIDTAYSGVEMKRTMALVSLPDKDQSLVIDVFEVDSEKAHQYDLPLHYKGQLVDANFDLNVKVQQLSALGKDNGYQHLWLKSKALPKAGLARMTWLNTNGRFYTLSSILDGQTDVLLTQIGANDPNYNLRNENAIIQRKEHAKKHTFVSLLEPHGEYNPSKEYTVGAVSQVSALHHTKSKDIDIVEIEAGDLGHYILAFNSHSQYIDGKTNNVSYKGSKLTFEGRYKLFNLSKGESHGAK